MNYTIAYKTFTLREMEGKVNSPEMVSDIFREDWNPIQESMYALICNNKNEYIKVELARGNANSLAITPRELFIHVLNNNGCSVVLAHTHPSGDVTPSQEDLQFTMKIKKACDIMGIKLLDHCIIGNGTYYSMSKEGVL